jgi:hypothetical protein
MIGMYVLDCRARRAGFIACSLSRFRWSAAICTGPAVDARRLNRFSDLRIKYRWLYSYAPPGAIAGVALLSDAS